MRTLYPSHKEILTNLPRGDPELSIALQYYVYGDPFENAEITVYGDAPESLKHLGRLISHLAKEMSLDIEVVVAEGADDLYNATNKVLVIGHQELIRGLHELGHALLGGNEFEVCCWSLGQLFRAFPELKDVAEFDGHRLTNGPH